MCYRRFPPSRTTTTACSSPQLAYRACSARHAHHFLEVFVRREEAERFIEEVRGEVPELATKLRMEERELDGGGLD